MKRAIPTVIILLAVLMLYGCGGGSGSSGSNGLSYTGTTTAAVINGSNAQPLAESAVAAGQQTITDLNGTAANPFGVVILNSATADVRDRIVAIGKTLLSYRQSGKLPVGITYTATDLFSGVATACGGSVTFSNSFLSNGSGTASFNNLCADFGTYQMIMNGDMDVATSGDQSGNSAGSSTITYSNFTITMANETYGPLNGSEACSWDNGGNYANETCTSSSFFSGGGGTTFKIADANVTDNLNGSYDIGATFYHPDFGHISLTATSLTFGCSAPNTDHPSSGSIHLAGDDGSMVDVTFTSCSTYTGSYTIGSSTVGFMGW